MLAEAKRASSGFEACCWAVCWGSKGATGVGDAAWKSMSREIDWPTGRGEEAGSALVEGGLCADAEAMAAARDLSLRQYVSAYIQWGRCQAHACSLLHLLAQLDSLLLLEHPDSGSSVCSEQHTSAWSLTQGYRDAGRAGKGRASLCGERDERTCILASLIQDELSSDLHLGFWRQELLNVFEAVAVQDEEAVVRRGRAGRGDCVSHRRRCCTGVRFCQDQTALCRAQHTAQRGTWVLRLPS